jgi:hypothetical protein
LRARAAMIARDGQKSWEGRTTRDAPPAAPPGERNSRVSVALARRSKANNELVTVEMTTLALAATIDAVAAQKSVRGR